MCMNNVYDVNIYVNICDSYILNHKKHLCKTADDSRDIGIMLSFKLQSFLCLTPHYNGSSLNQNA